MRVVVLAAGKSTRLDGQCKMLVRVKDRPVHRWHTDSWMVIPVDTVVLTKHVDELAEDGWDGQDIYGYDGGGGPVGALRYYLENTTHRGVLLVSFADSLLKGPVVDPGSWVGVAHMPMHRHWDYPILNSWMRGAPRIDVCMGLYQFEDIDILREVVNNLPEKRFPDYADRPMVDVIVEYNKRRKMRNLHIGGWQDAGDWEAISRIR